MKSRLFSPFVFFAASMVCLLGAFTSCSDEKEYVYLKPDTPDYKTALAALDWGTDTVYVVGHKIPDVDATCSAIAYARLMQELGYKCSSRMAGPVNREMAYVSEYFGIAIPQILDTVPLGQRLILTDHSEYAQAVNGAKQANVIQIIDHHNLGDVTSLKPLYCKVMPVGAACTIVYTSYKDLNVPISNEMAKVLLAGIMSDTGSLDGYYTDIDSIAFEALAFQLNLDSVAIDSIGRNMHNAAHNYYGMTDEEIFLSDYKDYEIEGVKLGIVSLDWYDMKTMDDLLLRMCRAAESLMQKNDNTMMFAKIDRHVPNPDVSSSEEYLDDGTYLVYAGDGAREVAERAYGPSVGNGWVYSKVKLSRKTDVVPAITEALKAMK